MMKKRLVICGGGSSAHALIPLLSDSCFDVSLYTSRPSEWNSIVELQYQNTDGDVIDKYYGQLQNASDNPSDVIPDADYIVFCMPVHKYRTCLHSIAPHINREKNVIIGAMYGQGGWNWMVEEIKNKFNLSNIVFFSFGLIPWIARTIEYGKIGVTYGCKFNNYAACYPTYCFNQIKNELFDNVCYKWFGKGDTEQSENFISLTLSVDNQIIHPTRCMGLYKKYGPTWKRKEDVPMFYKDYDDFSARLLVDLDNDYSIIRNKIKGSFPGKNFKHMLGYLPLERFSYMSENTDVRESFVTSKTLLTISTPTIARSNNLLEINTNHRFFLDDIYYGVCIAKWIAEKLDVDVCTIDEILRWAQLIRNESLIGPDNRLLLNSPDLRCPFKSGIPYYYGYTAIEDIID